MCVKPHCLTCTDPLLLHRLAAKQETKCTGSFTNTPLMCNEAEEFGFEVSLIYKAAKMQDTVKVAGDSNPVKCTVRALAQKARMQRRVVIAEIV